MDTSYSEMHSKAFPYTLIHGSHGSLQTEKVREYEKKELQALKIPSFFVKRLKKNMTNLGFSSTYDVFLLIATNVTLENLVLLSIDSMFFYRLTLQTNDCTAAIK